MNDDSNESTVENSSTILGFSSRAILILVCVFIVAWNALVLYWSLIQNKIRFDSWQPGLHGDSMGIITCIFTGLALYGVWRTYEKEVEQVRLLNLEAQARRISEERQTMWTSFELTLRLTQLDTLRMNISNALFNYKDHARTKSPEAAFAIVFTGGLRQEILACFNLLDKWFHLNGDYRYNHGEAMRQIVAITLGSMTEDQLEFLKLATLYHLESDEVHRAAFPDLALYVSSYSSWPGELDVYERPLFMPAILAAMNAPASN